MEMHVYNYINKIDKLVHILCAVYSQGLYEQTLCDAMNSKEYGKNITKRARRRFSKRLMKYYI